MKYLLFLAIAVLSVGSVSAQTYPTPTFSTLTLIHPLTPANGGTGVTSVTGSGDVVLNDSPSLIAPNLGTPTSVDLANATGLSLVSGVSGTLAISNGGTGSTSASGSGSVVLALGPSIYNPTLTAPTITDASISGVTDGSDAPAGDLGEYVSATNALASLTTATAANLTSISLTAGDWDVSGGCDITGSGNVLSKGACGVSTTSATMGSSGTYYLIQSTGLLTASGGSAPMRRISVATTTTAYLVVSATFASGTAGAAGFIQARRVR